jgi:hypothetical protein
MKIGDKVYIVGIHRRSGSNEPVEATVKKVGRKYFETDGYFGRFHIDTMLHDAGDYSPAYQAYNSLQEIQDEKHRNKLLSTINKFFLGYRSNTVTTEQAEQIVRILDLKLEE